ncbi:hypothetical protein I4I73_12570 [Pseudonocardia sp. KRD-184]|uniref:Uncharacterized protein n=2 Tax=Pseudonocardia oceani TaxID=2792013 RepID=A0ABS6UIG0_9PSEU|nr:hypothetical protein [Pseudonocardia oceani]MBW0090713.1 hypothetical protein [Pseudonocardia oceani]MBW0096822.1 hypothetical protein [Pseudonocardia oceani]MBW0109457.1 hypothetical protein [Pseudonocardia oceani]MBW0132036.1 hypothetical protein [Pseudonocardia oceani]
MVLAWVVAGIGLVLLVAVLLAVLPRVRRFSRAADELGTGIARGRAALPAVGRGAVRRS